MKYGTSVVYNNADKNRIIHIRRTEKKKIVTDKIHQAIVKIQNNNFHICHKRGSENYGYGSESESIGKKFRNTSGETVIS